VAREICGTAKISQIELTTFWNLLFKANERSNLYENFAVFIWFFGAIYPISREQRRLHTSKTKRTYYVTTEYLEKCSDKKIVCKILMALFLVFIMNSPKSTIFLRESATEHYASVSTRKKIERGRAIS
jgi:hypothetical protein